MTENVLRPCRICAEQFPQPKLLDLFGISSEIELLIGVPLIIGVDVPTSICTQCNAEFEAARDFKRKCIESNELFETKCESLVVPKIEHIPISPSGLSNDSFFREDSVQMQNEESDGTDDNDRDPDFTLPQEQNKSENNDTKDTPSTESKKHKSFENKSAKRVKKKKIEKTQNLMRRKQKERHPLVCDICGNIFKARHIFALHKRRHSNDKPYACELCPSKFFTNSELKRHMRRHTGEKPYECQYCHRKFSDYGTHVKHERTHTNTRPFACQHCGKAFSCGFVLKNHMLTHTGERNYKCTICNKSFGRQHNLTTHEKSIYHQNNLLKKENSEKLDQ